MINRLLNKYQEITEAIHFLGFESYMVYFNRITDWNSYIHDHPEWFKNWDKYLFEKTLSEIASVFDNNDWKYIPGTITDMSAAMCAMFDIFTCLKQDNASYLCYYFSSVVANNPSLPLRERVKGNQYRAFIFLKDNSWGARCELFCELHNDFDINYEGHFTKDFYDLSLLYDVYKAWHSIGGTLLNNLKKQAPLIKLQYSNYSKDQIMIEGELAHNSLFEYIRGEVEWG
jgi:hypothetical protein